MRNYVPIVDRSRVKTRPTSPSWSLSRDSALRDVEKQSFHTALSSDDGLVKSGYRTRNVSRPGSVMDLAFERMNVGSKLPSLEDGDADADMGERAPIRGASFGTAIDIDELESRATFSRGSSRFPSKNSHTPGPNPLGFSTLLRVDDVKGKDIPKTWFPVSGTEFSVRQGPNYSRNKQKALSEPNVYDTWGTDILTSGDIIRKIASRLRNVTTVIPDTPSRASTPGRLMEKTQVPTVLIINAQVPGPGSGFSFVSYSVLSPRVRDLIGTDKEPSALLLLRRLIREGKSTRELPLKVIGMLNDIDQYNIPGMIKNKNGQPALITASAEIVTGRLTQLPGEPSYVEIDYDIRKWSWFARQTLSAMRSSAQNMCLKIGYLIETEDDELLPEQMLTSFCLQKGDLTNVLDISTI